MEIKDFFGKKVKIATKSSIDWSKPSRSKPQTCVKEFLKVFWARDAVVEEFVIPSSRFRLDFFNVSKKIVVEVSPDEYHVHYNNFLHKNRMAFLEKIKADEGKRLWCISNDLSLIELYNEDIQNLSREYILEKFQINI